ncbi:hypothetical protein BJ508DRAFT_418130 [Ascobolus immersus RN42]|uniref:Uncharacterized protein n=1 Tax=Ascobolus immersus RN42 TaxID=1160509 RepID=A0A3N4HNR2_ASCIM|nr:hypothetical protein BJ508DRAFT_418130 [Ascobolus immersus RN42]
MDNSSAPPHGLMGYSLESISALRHTLNTSTATLRDLQPLFNADIISQAEKLHFSLLGLQKWVQSHQIDTEEQDIAIFKSLNRLTLTCTNLVLYFESHTSDFVLDVDLTLKTGPKLDGLKGKKEQEQLHQMLVHQSLAVGAFLKSAFLFERSEKVPDMTTCDEELSQVQKIYNSIQAERARNGRSFAKQLTEKLSALTSALAPSDKLQGKLVPKKSPVGNFSPPGRLKRNQEHLPDGTIAHRGTESMLWQSTQLRENERQYLAIFGSPWSGMDSESGIFQQMKSICTPDDATRTKIMFEYTRFITMLVMEIVHDFTMFTRWRLGRLNRLVDKKGGEEEKIEKAELPVEERDSIESCLEDTSLQKVIDLWKHDRIRNKFTESLEDCLPAVITAAVLYFMNRLDVITQDSYTPTDQDILMYTTPEAVDLSCKYFDLGDEFRVVQLPPITGHDIRAAPYFDHLIKKEARYHRHGFIYTINLAAYDVPCPDDPTGTTQLEAELKQYQSLMSSDFCKRQLSFRVFILFTGLTEFRRKLSYSPIKLQYPEFEGHAHSFLEGVAFFTEMFKKAGRGEDNMPVAMICPQYVLGEVTPEMLGNMVDLIKADKIEYLLRASGFK